MNIIKFLRGKRTYILAILGLVVVGLNYIGIVESDAMLSILSTLGMGGLATLRMAIPK